MPCPKPGVLHWYPKSSYLKNFTVMKKLTLLCMAALSMLAARANNIVVGNVSISGKNTTDKFQLVGFNVGWDNSWRTSTNESNYDGAWIFVKYRKANTQDWRHATLNVTGGTAGTGAAITVPADGKGGFVYRSANGLGNVSFTNNLLRWNYGADGVGDNETVEVRVFAVEMVYVPQGAYMLGSGGSEANFFREGGTTTPYSVVSNSSITVGTTPGTLQFPGSTGNISAAYPKGFNAFWCMKYETSQAQYADFLNHLDAARAATLESGSAFTGTHPNYVAPAPERAMNVLGYNRNAALADWSGLRPMTELEFEKASRGAGISPVPNEYVWGTTALTSVTTVLNQGASNETPSAPAGANANLASTYNSIGRTGLFARNNNSTRTLSGATYYGIMNMGDNVYELSFNATASNIDAAVHGDGNLSANATSDIAAWTVMGAWGFRGGSFQSTTANARTSDRQYVTYFTSFVGTDQNGANAGCRMVRTAP